MFTDLAQEIDPVYTVQLLKEMIQINSVVGAEAEIAEYLLRELKALGLEAELDWVEPNRPNVYACRSDGREGRRLMFNGHTDTVPVCDGWESDPFTPLVKDGKLYGLGACDMKAGLACALTAIRAMVESGYDFGGSIMFSGVIDEEAYSTGAKAMMKTPYAQCDAIILCEPYSGDKGKPIPLGITGKILYEVDVQGKAAHGFRPHLGVNAIEDAARIISSLPRMNMPSHPQFGSGNFCTLKIEGGYKVYSVVVPDSCRFEVNRLIVPGESTETAVKDLVELVESLNLESKVGVRTKAPGYEPFVMEPDEPILKIFHQVYRTVMGVEPEYEYASGITDANVFTGEAGIPCLHLGPRRGGAHQPNEHVEINWLPLISKMYVLTASRFLEG